MFNRFSLLAMLLVLLVLAAPAAQAHPQPQPAQIHPAQTAPSATSRWIIRLVDPPLVQARSSELPFAIKSHTTQQQSRSPIPLDDPAVRQYRAALQQQQHSVLQQVQALVPAAAQQRSYTIIFNGISVALPGAGEGVIEQIRGLPAVAEVYPEQEYLPALYGSIPIINADQLWENPVIGGVGNAGEGIKIAILDQGIKIDNPFFNPEGFSYPPGFPKGEEAHTTPKVIAARAYFRPDIPPLPGHESPQPGPQDSSHGTHVAGIAAGVANTSATVVGVNRTISGVAPRAYLMNYKIFYSNPSIFQGAFTTEVIAALEDAVADGADIINNSWGGRADTDPAFSPVALAAQAAADAGVVVIFAAGNEGPNESTAASPGYGTDFITVGATSTAETIAAGFVDVVAPAGAPETIVNQPFGPATFGQPIGLEVFGPLPYTPVSSISESPLACEPLPPGSLSGQIALIERGVCMFSIKVFQAQEAGASAAIIYNNEDGGDTVIVMAPGERSNEINIPSIFVGYSTGAGMTDWYATHGTAAQVQIDPQARIIEQTPDVVIGFSSRGPTFQHTLKPDVLAPGFNILSSGFDPLATGLKQHTGFGVSSGTSMATPHVAGAAALLKQAHPDWSSNDIKSALMSTATTEIWLDPDQTEVAGTLERGAGRIDLARAVSPGLIFDPPSLSYGNLQPTIQQPVRAEIPVNVRNVAGVAQSYSLSARPTGALDFAITTTPSEITLAAGELATFTVAIELPADAAPGDYEGLVELSGPQPLHLPLWARLLPEQGDATVLLIDNDASSSLELHNYADYYVNALEALGITYAYHDADALAGELQTLPGISELQKYPLIIWFTGDNSIADGDLPVPTPLTLTDQDLLIAYLQSGGNLIATGQDLTAASDIDRSPPDDPRYGRSDLYHGYLSARFVQDDVFTQTGSFDREAVGTGAQPWLEPITLDLSDPLNQGRQTGDDTGAGNQTSIDEILYMDADPRWLDPYTTPIIRAVNATSEVEGYIGLTRASSPLLETPRAALPYRTAYLAFGIEGVRSDMGTTTMHEFLQTLVLWALDWSTVEVLGDTTTTEPGQTVNFTADAQSTTGASFVRYRWDFGDGSPIEETTEPTVSHTFAEPGSYPVRVEATNYWGHSAVSPGDVPPPLPPEEQQPPESEPPTGNAAGQSPTATGGDTQPQALEQATGPRTFAETGQTLDGRFLSFWQEHGGLPIFGYPITPQSAGTPSVQHFERVRFEHHPQNPPPYDVLLGHLGVETLQAQGRDWRSFPVVKASAVVAQGSACRYFAETQHSLCGEFKAYWEQHGLEFDGQPGSSDAESLALFGLPISEPQQEMGEDGVLRTVQWFERARFEHHPQNLPPHDVLLGRLGAQQR